MGQNIDENKYVYSKYKAEELVLDAIAHHGLNAKIMRVGNLSARQQDGEFQINFNTNNFLALLRAYVVIGMVPYEELGRVFEFSPIDDVASAIMLLATTPKECTVFHPYNVHHQGVYRIPSVQRASPVSGRHPERIRIGRHPTKTGGDGRISASPSAHDGEPRPCDAVAPTDGLQPEQQSPYALD